MQHTLQNTKATVDGDVVIHINEGMDNIIKDMIGLIDDKNEEEIMKDIGDLINDENGDEIVQWMDDLVNNEKVDKITQHRSNDDNETMRDLNHDDMDDDLQNWIAQFNADVIKDLVPDMDTNTDMLLNLCAAIK